MSDCKFVSRITFALCSMALFIAGGRTSLAQNPMDQFVQIQCIDREGEPVAGAEIYLFQNCHNEEVTYQLFGPYESDVEGRATCPQPKFLDQEDHYDRWFYARIPDELVGVARSASWKGRAPFNPNGSILMSPSRTVEGQVHVPDGVDPTAVTVYVETMHVVTGPEMFDYESFSRSERFAGLENALPEIFQRQPDEGGRIEFRDVPVAGRLYLLAEAEGLGQAQWMNQDNVFTGPIDLTMVAESRVTGVVQDPDGEPLPGIEVLARLSGRGRTSPIHLSTFRATTNAQGEYELRGLPETEFNLTVRDPNGQWLMAPREAMFVPSGETSRQALQLEAGVEIQGLVVDLDGRPVPGAAISAVADTDETPGLDDDVTDEEGRYSLTVPTGRVKLYFNSLPDGFAYPIPQVLAELDLRADVKDLNFTLQRN